MKTLLCCIFAASISTQGRTQTAGIEPLGTIEPTRAVEAYAIEDLDHDGRAEIVLAGRDGQVRVWRVSVGQQGLSPLGAALQLPDPDHSLLAISNLVGDAKSELVVLGRRGVAAYAFDPSSGFDTNPTKITSGRGLATRLGRPVFAEFVRDVNSDGNPDLIVPTYAACELWMQRGAEDNGTPRFERAQVIPLQFERERKTRADLLSSGLRNRVEIPGLDIADIDGDGRPDLRVEDGTKRLFFRQEDGGRFGDDPILVDLSKFRDTTPKAGFELGATAVLGDEARMQSGDLDADGIDDYVIAHRRKLWTFLSTSDGPQFNKARTRIVAEDISGLVLLHLDEDDREDLVIFKVGLPNAAQLMLGFVSSIDIEVTVLGYRTGADGAFESSAHWRRTLTIRIPSIVRMMAEAEDILERFLDVIGKLRWSALGDFDGDGERDLALITEDESAVELWRKPRGADGEKRAGARWFRELLFENPDTVFDVERMLSIVAQVFDVRTASMTGERGADLKSTLPKRANRALVDLIAADLDGDGDAELILVDDDVRAPGQMQFTVLRWAR